MALLDFFKRNPPTAVTAKERLRIIVAQEGRGRGSDYLPTLRRELLAVISKYVTVDPEAVQINLENDAGHQVLELTVALPEGPPRG